MFEEPFEFPPRKILSPCQVDATQTTRASGSCPGKIGERTCPLNISRVCTRRKEKEKNLFFICCRDVLLFPGRRILSQRLLQGILRQPFLHRSFSILENEHVARLALAPTHPSSIKLYARNIFPAWECERKSNFNRAGISFRPEENAISLINIGKGRESHDKTYTPCVHGYIRRSGENKKETAHKKEGGGKEKKRKRWFFGPQVRGAHAWSCSFFKTFLLLLLLEIISETPEGPLRDLRTTPPGVPLASFIRKYYELTRSAQPVSMISCFRAIV